MLWLREQEQEQECSPDYIHHHISKYNQKVAAEGDDQLAEPTLPILFKSVMFEYWVSQNYKQLKIYFPKNHSYSFNFLREN